MKSVYWLLLLLLIADCYWFANGTNATITPEELEYEINEGDGMVSICLNVTADSNTNEPFEITVDTIAVYTMGVTAMTGSDFIVTGSPLAGTVTNNGPLLCFDVIIIDDDAAEGTEYINITLSASLPSILIDEPNIIVTIMDNNDITATVNNTVTIMEGSMMDVCVTFSVPLDGLSNTIVVNGDITNQSTEDNDYNITGQPLTFNPSMDSTITNCISINAINDGTPEGEEMFVITWNTSSSIVVTFMPTTTTVIIEGHLTPSLLNSTDITSTEGDTIQLCIGLDGPATVLLNYPYTLTPDTATDQDYTVTDGASGNLTIEPNNQTGCIMIELDEDMIVEETEMFTVSFPTISMSSTISITDNDVLSLTVTDSITVNESTGWITIQLTQVNTSLTVNVPILINITTTTCDGCDFNISSSSITQVNGTIMLCTIMDNLVEGTESFLIDWIIDSTVTPSNVMLDNNQTNITIIDTTYASIGFTEATVSVGESTNMYTPQIEVTSANIAIVTGFYISVTYMNRTAIAGQDFLFVDSDSIYWNGSVPPLINNVTIIDNEIVEYTESLTLLLAVISNGLNIDTSISQQDITIIDNDQSIIMTPDTQTYNESIRNARLCFDHTKQIAPKSDSSNYILSFNTTDITANVDDDYTLSTNTVVIPLLRSNQICINIDIDDDAIVEDPETFVINWYLDPLLPDITLMNPFTTVTITDNDVPTTSTAAPTMTSSSATPSSTVAPTSSSAGLLGTYAIIGIIVGVVAAGVCFLLVLICVICCVKIRMNRQGFYPTNEDKGEAPQMLRYSASLRSLQSQTVMPADPRDKENEYMV